MPLYPESFVNRVQQAIDIVELIGQYVALKKSGREFVGLCPFHDDHRPSMTVSPAKQIFKCFVCGAGGDAFRFLMLFQKLSFPEAVRALAERARVPLPASGGEAPDADRSLAPEALVKATTFAARFFRDRLNAPAGAAALEYARSRRLSDESIRRFGLGYAPNEWEALGTAAVGAGFTDRQLLAAGLIAQRDDGRRYDRFRNRLMFPILDPAGKVIAFGGRALDPADRAKYLNSPDTPLFDKSANLYALNWSRPGIVGSGQVVVVEGYLDALMCLQAGLDNVVATLGTSLTERHVRILGRFSREVVLVFDADAAGQAAAERAIELFLSQRLNVRVASVPAQEGLVKDPCDYVLAAGPEAMRALIAGAPDALEYAWGRRLADYGRAGTLAEKAAVVEDFLALVVSSAAFGAVDPLRRGLLANHLGGLIGLSPTEIAEQMRRIARRRPAPRPHAPTPPGRATADEPADPHEPPASARAEGWLLGVLLNAPELFDQVAGRIDPGMFATPLLRAVAEQVWHLAAAGRLELSAVLAAGESERWGRIVTDLQLDAERRGNYAGTLADVVADFLRRREREDLQQYKASAEAPHAEVLQRIAEQARKPDPRRRPRL